MCGRFALKANIDSIEERFSAQAMFSNTDFAPSFNIAPSQICPVIVASEKGRQIKLMKWGLIPSWSKESKANYSTINARVEGIETKPAFRKPFKSQHCLVPANGFFEWKKPELAKAPKVPYFITMRGTNAPLFAMAGLYDIWRDGQGQELYSFTIITTEANELIKPLHERMAVILPEESESIWLDTTTTNPAKFLSILKPFPPELMATYRVSNQVNSPYNNTPELIEPLL
jgi:putative SOS response-associated peptidase YedK